MDILTIGEVLIDLTQTGKDERGIPQFAANPGGAPANLAVAASRLGAQTAFIGKVGADAFGRYLKEVLAENKVDDFGSFQSTLRNILVAQHHIGIGAAVEAEIPLTGGIH